MDCAPLVAPSIHTPCPPQTATQRSLLTRRCNLSSSAASAKHVVSHSCVDSMMSRRRKLIVHSNFLPRTYLGSSSGDFVLCARADKTENGCFDLSDAEDGEEREEGQAHSSDNIEIESLDLLEWRSVCEQVGSFAHTPMGREACRQASIPFGRSQEESEELLQQTASACGLSSPLDFAGIVDVSDILRSAKGNSVCSIEELCVIEKTLSSSKRLFEQLQSSVPGASDVGAGVCGPDGDIQGHPHFSPLISIMKNSSFCESLAQELKESLDSASLSIIDSASPSLATIRVSRRENMETLETLLQEIGEEIVASGGMDSVMITSRRARQCIAVRSSHKHLLSGGLVLSYSNSGATVFMEPKRAFELNNNEVRLSIQEKAEEIAILERLTKRLAASSDDIWILLHKVTSLDLACARAGHARWLNSVQPVFVSDVQEESHITKGSSSSYGFSIYIEGLFHPLLLGPALVVNEKQRSPPVPLNFQVKSDVSVIVVSGPNTGGKTASMKTLGVAALMAKGGLFLPAKGSPLLPWFDKVLADIGDSQSLEQNLSTFSGHIKRVCKIINAGREQSLVLLDELGSGTDPSEGVAIAMAILQHMAEYVRLTIATTHFSKLSSFTDRRFDIASVEFDTETLQPKYHVLWGIAGKSYALDIANTLGVDRNILDRAKHWLKQLAPQNEQTNVSQIMDPLLHQRRVLQSQVEISASTLLDAKNLFNELSAEVDDLESRLAGLRLQRENNLQKDIRYVTSELDAIVSNFANFSKELDKTGKDMRMGEALKAITSIIEPFTEKLQTSLKNDVNLNGAEQPRAGDLVRINRLGRSLATVIESPSDDDETLLVQLGSWKVRAKLSEVSKVVKGAKVENDSFSNKQGKEFPLQTLESPQVTLGAAIQTSRNTVDLRGMYVEDAVMHLEFVLRSRRSSVVFLVHGEGTGALRTALWKKLKVHPLVLKFEQESPMNYGCTVVYLK